MYTYRVDGEVLADGELVLDALVDLLLDLLADVLVLVGRAEHLVDLAVGPIQLLLVGRGTLRLQRLALLGFSPKKNSELE